MASVYFIKVSGVSKEKVHRGFIYMDEWQEPDTYTLFLAITGRLSNKETNRANLDSQELADQLLAYWLPGLKSRGWGDFKAKVVCERANKWVE